MKATEFSFKRGMNPKVLERANIFFKTLIAQKLLAEGIHNYQICIRDNYINIYWKGCSVLRYHPNSKSPFRIHYKYTDLASEADQFEGKDPYIKLKLSNDGNDLVSQSGWRFSGLLENPFAYISQRHISGEKESIQKYLGAMFKNKDIFLIDLEIAFRRGRTEDERIKSVTGRKYVADRIDLARIEMVDGLPYLVLTEVKLVRDSRLKAEKDSPPEIIAQMIHYREFLQHESQIIETYKLVAANYLHFIHQKAFPEKFFTSFQNIQGIKILELCQNSLRLRKQPELLIIGTKKELENGRINHLNKLRTLLKEHDFDHPKFWLG